MIWILINLFFMSLSLWVAFAKVNKPITWTTFYINLVAAGINFVAICMNINRMLTS